MPQRLLPSVIAVAFTLAVAGRPAAAVEPEAARALVQAASADMLATFAGKTLSRDQAKAAMQRLVDKYCDMELESQQILGRYWARATPDQRREFRRLLEGFFVGVVGGMVDGVAAEQRIVVQSAERDGDRVVVHSLAFVPREPAAAVHWVVMDGTDGRPVIVDASAEGVALVATLQADFTSVVRAAAGHLEGLFEPLRRKIAGLGAAPPPPPPPASTVSLRDRE
jgi:phospholipid transport system substrate-binding protein